MHHDKNDKNEEDSNDLRINALQQQRTTFTLTSGCHLKYDIRLKHYILILLLLFFVCVILDHFCLYMEHDS